MAQMVSMTGAGPVEPPYFVCMRIRRRFGGPVRSWERLGSGGTRCRRGGYLLGAAFNDGPGLAAKHTVSDGAFSHFYCGGLPMSHEMQLKPSPLSPRNRIGHPCGCDEEFQLVWAGDEARGIGRVHRFHGPVHAFREIRRRRWKVCHLVGFGLTKIGPARHASREQARQTNDRKTFQLQTSMWEVLCQSRYEKNSRGSEHFSPPHRVSAYPLDRQGPESMLSVRPAALSPICCAGSAGRVTVCRRGQASRFWPAFR